MLEARSQPAAQNLGLDILVEPWKCPGCSHQVRWRWSGPRTRRKGGTGKESHGGRFCSHFWLFPFACRLIFLNPHRAILLLWLHNSRGDFSLKIMDQRKYYNFCLGKKAPADGGKSISKTCLSHTYMYHGSTLGLSDTQKKNVIETYATA
jgi:hypothetical protein